MKINSWGWQVRLTGQTRLKTQAQSYHLLCLIESVSLNLSSGHGWLLPSAWWKVYSLGTCGDGGASCCRGGNQATTVIVKSPPRWGESGAFILNSTVFTYQLQTQHTQSNFCDEQNKFQFPHPAATLALLLWSRLFYKSDMSAPVSSVVSCHHRRSLGGGGALALPGKNI